VEGASRKRQQNTKLWVCLLNELIMLGRCIEPYLAFSVRRKSECVVCNASDDECGSEQVRYLAA
jgi:hypothetical protein